MKYIHTFFITIILLASLILFSINIFAEESDENRINFNSYNLSLSTTHPQGWVYVTQDKMNTKDLAIMKKNKDTMLDFFSSNDLIYYSVNNNNTAEIRVSVKSTQLSQNIYNIDKANYNKLNEYINSLESINALPSQSEIINTKDRYTHNQITFAVIEYSQNKTYGICYSTIINGKSINIDCRYQNANIEKTIKNDLKNFVSEMEFEVIDNPNAFDKEQIFMALCGGFIGLLFIVLLIVTAKRKKNKY